MNASKLGGCNVGDWLLSGNSVVVLPDEAYSSCTTACTNFASGNTWRKGATYELVVDSTTSYIKGKMGSAAAQQSPLKGSISVKNVGATKQFLGGKVWATAASTTVGTYTLSNWRAFFDAPMTFTGLNPFSITGANATAGQAAAKGTSNSATVAEWLEPGTAITGHINTSSMTWDADYAYTTGSLTVTLHMQGSVVAAAF